MKVSRETKANVILSPPPRNVRRFYSHSSNTDLFFKTLGNISYFSVLKGSDKSQGVAPKVLVKQKELIVFRHQSKNLTLV